MLIGPNQLSWYYTISLLGLSLVGKSITQEADIIQTVIRLVLAKPKSQPVLCAVDRIGLLDPHHRLPHASPASNHSVHRPVLASPPCPHHWSSEPHCFPDHLTRSLPHPRLCTQLHLSPRASSLHHNFCRVLAPHSSTLRPSQAAPWVCLATRSMSPALLSSTGH